VTNQLNPAGLNDELFDGGELDDSTEFLGGGTAAVGSDDDSEVLDLDSVPDKIPFEVVVPGNYDAVCDEVNKGTSQRSGNPMLTWKFSSEIEGKKRVFFFHTAYHDERGKSQMKATAKAINPEINLKEFRPAQAGMHLVGMPCTLQIGIQNYNGERRNNVRAVLPARQASNLFD
jgi:hypothetical protein